MKLLKLLELNIYSSVLALIFNFVVVALLINVSFIVAYLISYIISINLIIVLRNYKI